MPEFGDSKATRRKDMFSPTVAISSVRLFVDRLLRSRIGGRLEGLDIVNRSVERQSGDTVHERLKSLVAGHGNRSRR